MLPSSFDYVQGSAGGNGAYDNSSGTVSWSLNGPFTTQPVQVSFQAIVDPATPVNTIIANPAALTNAAGTQLAADVAYFFVVSGAVASNSGWWNLRSRRATHRLQRRGRSQPPDLQWAYTTNSTVISSPADRCGRHGVLRVE